MLADQNTGLEGPGAGNVSHCVAAASNNKSGEPKALDVVDTVGVPIHTQIEAAQSVARQAVATTLQDYSFGLVEPHDIFDNRFKYRLVRFVRDTIAKRIVDSVVFALADTNVSEFARSREVLSVLVERHGHDAIGGIEGFLYAITVVDIDVNIEDSLLESQ